MPNPKGGQTRARRHDDLRAKKTRKLHHTFSEAEIARFQNGALTSPAIIPEQYESPTNTDGEDLQRLSTRLRLTYAKHQFNAESGHGWVPKGRRLQEMAAFIQAQRPSILAELAADASPHAMHSEKFGGTELLFTKDGKTLVNMGMDKSLGQGGQKHVFKAFDVDTGRPYAWMVGHKGHSLESEATAYKQISGIAGTAQLAGIGVMTGDNKPGTALLQELYTPLDMASKQDASLSQGDKRLDLVIDYVRGLAGLHARGLVHRDIKPENLMLDAQGHGLVSDIGLLTNDPTWDASGTPEFMPPDYYREMLPYFDGQTKYTVQNMPKVPAFRAKAFDTFAMGLALSDALGDASTRDAARDAARLIRPEAHPMHILAAAAQGPDSVLRDRVLGTVSKAQTLLQTAWEVRAATLEAQGADADPVSIILLEMCNPATAKIMPVAHYLRRLEALRSQAIPKVQVVDEPMELPDTDFMQPLVLDGGADQIDRLARAYQALLDAEAELVVHRFDASTFNGSTDKQIETLLEARIEEAKAEIDRALTPTVPRRRASTPVEPKTPKSPLHRRLTLDVELANRHNKTVSRQMRAKSLRATYNELFESDSLRESLDFEEVLKVAEEHLDQVVSLKGSDVHEVAYHLGDGLTLRTFAQGKVYLDLGDGAALGKGAFKQVTKGIDLFSDDPVALANARDNQAVQAMVRESDVWERASTVRGVMHAEEFGVTGTAKTGATFVMPIVQGDLEQGLKPDLSPAQRLNLMISSFEALANLHDANIVHRDIKPANLFLEEDQVLLGDLGLASEATAVGSLVGTPNFMHPDMVQRIVDRCETGAGSAEFDAESTQAKAWDVYALGQSWAELVGSPSAKVSETANGSAMKHGTMWARAKLALKPDHPQKEQVQKLHDSNQRAFQSARAQQRHEWQQHASELQKHVAKTPEAAILWEIQNPDSTKIKSARHYLEQLRALRQKLQ